MRTIRVFSRSSDPATESPTGRSSRIRVKLPSGREIVEFPIASYTALGRNWPVGGGGYHRLLPGWTSRALARRVMQSAPFNSFIAIPTPVRSARIRRDSAANPLESYVCIRDSERVVASRRVSWRFSRHFRVAGWSTRSTSGSGPHFAIASQALLVAPAEPVPRPHWPQRSTRTIDPVSPYPLNRSLASQSSGPPAIPPRGLSTVKVRPSPRAIAGVSR